MNQSSSLTWDVIVAGGGPAGFFAAIRCAELNPRLKVLILEKAQQPLGKVLISGGGRCNATHACFEPAQLVTYYPRGGLALRGAFTRFQPADTVKWFEAHGAVLKAESDGRMFPVSDSSETIANCLRESEVRCQMCSSSFCRRGVASSDAADSGCSSPFGRSVTGAGDGAAATGGRFRWNRESMWVSWWRASGRPFRLFG